MSLQYTWHEYLEDRRHPFSRVLSLFSVITGLLFLCAGIIWSSLDFVITAAIWFFTLNCVSLIFLTSKGVKLIGKPVNLLQGYWYDIRLFSMFLRGSLAKNLKEHLPEDTPQFNWDMFRWIILSSITATLFLITMVAVFRGCVEIGPVDRCNMWVPSIILLSSVFALTWGHLASMVGLLLYFLVSSQLWKQKKHTLLYYTMTALTISALNGIIYMVLAQTSGLVVGLFAFTGFFTGLFHSVILQNLDYSNNGN